jgi:pentatricopeptide repeat protein
MYRLLIIALFFISCHGNATQLNTVTNYNDEFESIKADSLLNGIQDKILEAFVQSFITNNESNLSSLNTELQELYNKRKKNLILYWVSYLQFYKSIYFLSIQDKKNAKKEVEKAIDIMDELEGKNSEDYALLAMLQGFSFQFSSGFKAPFLAKKVSANIKMAFELDSTNIRAYYVSANNDFYTPVKYGGGKLVEKHALKAISLADQKIKNNYLPSWGKEQAYETLIKFYIRNKKWDLAVKFFKQAKEKYPDSYIINLLASDLVNK